MPYVYILVHGSTQTDINRQSSGSLNLKSILDPLNILDRQLRHDTMEVLVHLIAAIALIII